MSDTSARHVPVEIVEAYREKGVPGTLVVDGDPACSISISPQHKSMSLLVKASDGTPGPELRDLANLEYELVEGGGAMWHRIAVTYDDNLTEIYPVLCSILDRVQLAGEGFGHAVDDVLAGLGDILAGRGGLTHEQQVGLFGELAALLSLVSTVSPRHAISAWRGHQREEHDFGLADDDVEVKTTLSERRSHWVSSLTQLMPTAGRSLHLLSIQLTAAGEGPGASLASLVQAARGLPGVPVNELEKALGASGYRDRHADLYGLRWTLRSAAEFYLVDEAFPALTPTKLTVSVQNAGRIKDVRYRIDLQGLEPSRALFPLTLTGESQL